MERCKGYFCTAPKIENGLMEAGTDLLLRIADLLETNRDGMLALCGRINPDLEKIICKNPIEISSILRTIDNLSIEQIISLKKYLTVLQDEEQNKERDEK